MPLTLTLEPEGQTLFVRQEPWLRRLGIEWRASGNGRTILRVPAALRQSNLADSLPRLLQVLPSWRRRRQIFRQRESASGLANMTPSRLDGTLMAATQVLADLEADGPELLNLAAIRRPLPLAGWIEELLLHE
jgi:DNA mismatch repair ATPase MutL